MSKFEKLGSFLLFEKIEEDKLSKDFLAGQIVNNQIQNIHLVKKFDHSLSTLPDFILDLNQEYESIKSLANPNIVKPNIFVQERTEFAAVFDYVEGKSLRAILNKCGEEENPFTIDHALLIGSRLCTALEYLHSKKVNDHRLVHGFVSPETVFVTYDGEIKLQYLGLAHALMKFAAGRDKFFHDYRNYLAPEVLNHLKMDKAADTFGAGLVFYEMLTGEALFAKSRNISISDAIEKAHTFLTSGERAPLSDDVKKVLHQSIALEASQRYASISDMRKALDLLLFSSEFSPTTFNLAFFMHSLFRESIDEENKSVSNLKKMDISSYIKEEPPVLKPEHPVGASTAEDVPAIPITADKSAPSFGQPDIFGAEPAKEKSKMPLIIGGILALAVIGTLAIFVLPSSDKAPQQQAQTAPAMTPAQVAAQNAEKQRLEEEAARAQEEAKKKDEQLASLQAKLDAILKAQEVAKKQATSGAAPASATVDVEALKRLQMEKQKLEEEKRQQEELAELKRKEAQAAPAPPDETPVSTVAETKIASAAPGSNASPPTATNQPPVSGTGSNGQASATMPPPVKTEAPPPPSIKAVQQGDLVELTPDVVKPVVAKQVKPNYPVIAATRKIEGTVILSLLISENGDVVDVKVLRAAGGSSGLNEAATAAVKKWKFKPAVKEGKRVKVWVTYPVAFKLGN